MISREQPNWRVDVKWASGVLLALTLIFLIPLLTLSQLSSQRRAVPIFEEIFADALAQTGEDAPAVTSRVRVQFDYQPGEPLEVLPGSGVTIPAGQLDEVGPWEAVQLLASDWAGRTVNAGAAAVARALSGSTLEARYAVAMEGAGARLVADALLTSMLPAGLDNGSRVANWPLQAQQNPGQEVQPIVGLFVTVDPGRLQGLSSRDIGVLVVEELAGMLLDSGLDAAAELVSNVNLLNALNEGATLARARLETLFESLLLAQEAAIGERLALARTAIEASEAGGEAPASGLLTQAEVAGLDEEEAQELVASRLAQRAWQEGRTGVVDSLSGDASYLLAAAGPAIDLLARPAAREYVTASWGLGIVALALAVILLTASNGWGRLANLGLVQAVTAGGLAWLLVRFGQEIAALPVFATFGTEVPDLMGLTWEGWRGLLLLPDTAFEHLLRNLLLFTAAGLLLLLLSVLLRLVGAARPRRRRRLL